MKISRVEIAAAARAWRESARRPAPQPAVDVVRATLDTALVVAYAAQVCAEPTYRHRLVSTLQNSIDAGTYQRRSDEIADQMWGRLLAAAIPG